MTHGQPHEEAEHAAHHAADPFDRRVAMTMVVVAALLAGVKVLGHRTHNDTLGYQIKAGVANTEKSNQFNFYQAKKMRQHLYESQAELLGSLAPAEKVVSKEPEGKKSDEGPAKKARRDKTAASSPAEKIADWKKQAKRYRKETEGIKVNADEEGKRAENYQHLSEHKHHTERVLRPRRAGRRPGAGVVLRGDPDEAAAVLVRRDRRLRGRAGRGGAGVPGALRLRDWPAPPCGAAAPG